MERDITMDSSVRNQERRMHRSNGAHTRGRARGSTHTGEHGGVAEPLLKHDDREIQAFESMVRMPLDLDRAVCEKNAEALNLILADTIVLRDLYKKHHWQVAGPEFYPLHLLFDKHAEEQSDLIDLLAERVQTLGGISVAMGQDVAAATDIPRPPRGRETPAAQISRLLEAHRTILEHARKAARQCEKSDDLVSNDILVSDVLRTGERQAWFIAEHLAQIPADLATAESQS